MKTLSSGSARSAGFTLVELLLAITLMSFLLALAYGGMRAATRATQSGQLLLEESSSIRSAHQFVRRQINQMQPLPFAVAEDADLTRIVFSGNGRRIQFVGPMPGYLGSGGPQVQVLEIVSGNDGDELQFSHALLQEFEPERLFDREPIVLLDGIESGGFEFLVRDEEGTLAGWTPAWERSNQLPVAVSLGLAFRSERPVIWPLLTTGVRVDEMAVAIGGGRSGNSYQDAIRDLIENPDGDDR